jgi:hypothetical protein
VPYEAQKKKTITISTHETAKEVLIKVKDEGMHCGKGHYGVSLRTRPCGERIGGRISFHLSFA